MNNHSLLFYVLPQQTANFAQVKQNLLQITPNQIIQDLSNEAVFNSLKYRFSLRFLGKAYQQLFIVCIPGKEHQVIASQNYQPVNIPKLAKIASQSDLKGFLSGHRSAIKIHQNKLIRYKGCGNDNQGFVVTKDGLRGSHFFHTAKRELFMTDLINKILLKATSQPSANEPLFMYQFGNQIETLGLKNELSLVRKYCCVFETKGDRRVGTHLISPLEILFLNLFETKPQKELQLFFRQKKRLDGEFGLIEMVVNYELMLMPGEIFLQKYDSIKDEVQYVGIQQYTKYFNQKLQVKQNHSQILEKIGQKFSKGQKLSLQVKNQLADIFRIVLQKLGWQMGHFKRILCKNSINWGFFNDHGYWHCNAHLNNFVVTPPTQNSKFVLPLDFDLAFTKQQFINIELDAQSYGKSDDDVFENFLLAEFNAMQFAISGMEIMNFKYSIGEEDQAASQYIKMARVVFRDTLIQGFRWGMRQDLAKYERINSQWNANIQQIYKLVETCLTVSLNFTT